MGTGTAYTWEELAGAALARQFPDVPAGASVAECARMVGPIQSQIARSPFIGLAARFPQVDHASLTAAYEEFAIVRGSTLRGTVHTAVAAEHGWLDAVTRIGQRTLWERTLRLRSGSLEDVWGELESYAAAEWHSPADLISHLRMWLQDNANPHSAERLDNAAGRHFGFGHGGLIRRPLKGGWDGQGAPGYRAARAVLGSSLPQADEAVDAAVCRHLASHGPSSRQDLAWWSGLGLRVVDASLARLDAAGRSDAREGPDGRVYVDLTHGIPAAVDPASVGVRLLPEFDALLCGYEPAGRRRFVSVEHHERLWSAANGQCLAPMVRGGRLVGAWRVSGSGARRSIEVGWFAGTGRPRKAEVEQAAEAVARGLGFTVTEVSVAAVS